MPSELFTLAAWAQGLDLSYIAEQMQQLLMMFDLNEVLAYTAPIPVAKPPKPLPNVSTPMKMLQPLQICPKGYDGLRMYIGFLGIIGECA